MCGQVALVSHWTLSAHETAVRAAFETLHFNQILRPAEWPVVNGVES
jgi:hypothetical protein